jgi:Copper type II ascorbate-dependent monooxygenase, C-terminal domain
MRFFLLSSVVCLAAFACGTTADSPAGPNADGGGGSSGDLDGGPIGLDGQPAPLGSFSVSFGPQEAPSSEEHTKCVVKRLGNPTSMHVGTVHNVLGKGSHHLIVYRVNDTVEQTTPFDCKPFTDTLDPTKGSTLMISQKEDDALVLPEGVAYTLEANQMVRLEMHYINPNAGTINVQSTTTFIPIEDAKFKDEADFLFIGTPDIDLKVGEKKTIGPMHITLPPEYDDVNFFAITGHEHQWGTNVVVSTALSKTDPGTPVYDVKNWLWSEPATVQGNFKLPKGGGFNFSCSYDNRSGQQVGFGESANDEMCFFWAYYYPSKGGAKVCVHSDRTGGAGIDACCPADNLICDYLKGK